jgi:hypothetical protein
MAGRPAVHHRGHGLCAARMPDDAFLVAVALQRLRNLPYGQLWFSSTVGSRRQGYKCSSCSKRTSACRAPVGEPGANAVSRRSRFNPH